MRTRSPHGRQPTKRLQAMRGREESRMTTRQRLFEAVYETVYKYGIEGATTKRIAVAAHSSEPLIYRSFSSKEELFREAFLDLDKRYALFMQRELKKYADPDTDEALEAIGKTVRQALLDDPIRTVFMVRYRYSGGYDRKALRARMTYKGDLPESGSGKKLYRRFMNAAALAELQITAGPDYLPFDPEARM